MQSTLYTPDPLINLPNCTPIYPVGNDFSQPLILGDGFEVHDLVGVGFSGDNYFSGWGNLRVYNDGVPIAFHDISVADE